MIISSTYDEFGSIIHLFSNLPFHPCPNLPSRTCVPPVPVDEKKGANTDDHIINIWWIWINKHLFLYLHFHLSPLLPAPPLPAQGIIPTTVAVIAVAYTPTLITNAVFLLLPFLPFLRIPPSSSGSPPIPPPMLKWCSRFRTWRPRSVKLNPIPSRARRQKEWNDNWCSYHQHMMN